MLKVKLKKGETRKDYLLRVAMLYIRELDYDDEDIFFDEAVCSGSCLADDIENVLNL